MEEVSFREKRLKGPTGIDLDIIRFTRVLKARDAWW
jgi:hypothetical protein